MEVWVKAESMSSSKMQFLWKKELNELYITPTGPPGTPPGVPFEVQKGSLKNLIKIRHVGYQFYSDFSTENEYRVHTPKFRIRLPWGGPLGFPRSPLGRFPKNLCNEHKACWVSILLRFQLWKRIQGRHTKILNQTPMGWLIGVPQKPPWEVSKEPM